MKKRAPEIYKERLWWERLSEFPVHAVTGVILRQHNRRQLTQILRDILCDFPGLQEFHYEPWRRVHDLDQADTDNFTPKYQESYDPAWGQQVIRIRNFWAPEELARISRKLEHLSISFMGDASDFIRVCEPLSLWEWSNLTSLALTSRLLAPYESTTKIGDVLRTAANVAMRMPKLRVMEIWNGQDGLAALFQYRSIGYWQRPVITWRATWDYALQPAVIRAWEEVGIKHRGENPWNDCVVVNEHLNAADVSCHGDAIHHLKLSSSVIRPVSLHQIRTENRILEGVHEW
ncbi:hypothetical protein CKAH01_09357 [Colletotrichum kahawae]|uniref:DUF6546 domain-containing protein n=1 Tax=Colletotrichum kahawae TaxID=34407 RepID=A0AAE0D0E4_COLKA|nr:hypothetical protein CKAH01_09357 [Colletotrichum kahawae]